MMRAFQRETDWRPAVAAGAAMVMTSGAALAGPLPNEDIWYLPTTDKAASLYVREVGPPDQPPVVVLHGGFGAEHSYMLDVIEPLAGKIHFVMYDQRGSLRSPADPKTNSIDKQVEDLELLRQNLGVDRLTLFAHSMGTFLAFSYLKAHPDHVANLVLAGTVRAKIPDPVTKATSVSDDDFAMSLTRRPEVLAELRANGLDKEGLTARQATHAWRIRFTSVNAMHVERWRSMSGGRVFYNPETGNAIGATLPKTWDFEPLLSSGRYKVTVIDGDHDYVDPGQVYWKDFAARSPQIHLTVLPNAGHSSWLDEPERFQAALVEGLKP